MATRARGVDTSAWAEWLIGCVLGKKIVLELPERSDQKCRVVPLDTTLALAAADLQRAHGLATADAIVLANALGAGADLLTCDAHFGSLPGVVYLAKAGRR